MKIIFAVLGFVLLANTVSAFPANNIDIPKKCTDLLTTETCQKIEDIATKLKLSSEEALAIIQQVVEDGVTDVKELYAKVVTYMGELSCAKILGADTCKKITDYASKLKLDAQDLMVIITKAIDSGVTDAKELYAKVVKYMSELTCAKVLGADRCQKLYRLADILLLDFQKVVIKLTEYYEQGVTKASELFKKLVDYIKGSILGDELEMEFLEKRGIIDLYKFLKEKINKILDKLRNLPGMTDKLLNAIRAKVDALIESGKFQAVAKYIKDLVDKYFPQTQADSITTMDLKLTDFKCTDSLKIILSPEFCKDIEDLATKLQLTYDEVQLIIKNVRKVVQDVTKMYHEIKEFMSELSCEKLLGTTKCAQIKLMASLVGIDLDAVILEMRTLFENGITSVTELYKKITDWVSGIFGDEMQVEFVEKRGVIDYIKEKFNKLIEKIKNTPGITKKILDAVQAKIDAFLKSGAGDFQAMAEFIKELVNFLNGRLAPKPSIRECLQSFQC